MGKFNKILDASLMGDIVATATGAELIIDTMVSNPAGDGKVFFAEILAGEAVEGATITARIETAPAGADNEIDTTKLSTVYSGTITAKDIAKSADILSHADVSVKGYAGTPGITKRFMRVILTSPTDDAGQISYSARFYKKS